MNCLICTFQSIEIKDFIALDFALDKKVCKNCSFALGEKARKCLLDSVKVVAPDPYRGILPQDKKDWTP